jgi:hypothetical protein
MLRQVHSQKGQSFLVTCKLCGWGGTQGTPVSLHKLLYGHYLQQNDIDIMHCVPNPEIQAKAPGKTSLQSKLTFRVRVVLICFAFRIPCQDSRSIACIRTQAEVWITHSKTSSFSLKCTNVRKTGQGLHVGHQFDLTAVCWQAAPHKSKDHWV